MLFLRQQQKFDCLNVAVWYKEQMKWKCNYIIKVKEIIPNI
jgi:hypothetical protein